MSEDRYGFRDLVGLRGLPTTLLVVGGVLATIVLAPWLTDHGYPGFALLVLVWLCAMAVVAVVLWSRSPHRSRRVALSTFARRRGGTFVPVFDLPRSIRSLPSFASGYSESGARCLVTLRDPSGPLLLFDRWVEGPSAYSETVWTAVAAWEIPMDGDRLIVSPRSLLPPLVDGLVEIHTESEAFDDRFTIRCTDRRFGSALIDQRMIEWMLERDAGYTFEVGGRWLAVGVHGRLDQSVLERLVDVLGMFTTHVPRVVRSLYPPSPPPLGALSDPWS